MLQVAAQRVETVRRGGSQHALVARLQAQPWLAPPLLAWALAEPLGFGLAGIGAAFAAFAAFAAVNGAAALAFARLFTGDAAVAALAVQALRTTGPAFGFFGLGMAMYFASMRAQRTGAPVIAGCGVRRGLWPGRRA